MFRIIIPTLKMPAAALVSALTRSRVASTCKPVHTAHAVPPAAGNRQLVNSRLPLLPPLAATYSSGAGNSDASVAPTDGPSEAELVLDMCTGHWKQQALRAAVKLGVFDAFPDPNRPAGLASLATATGVLDREYLYRLLRYLCQFNLFMQLDDQTFELTSMGQYLRSDHPSGLRYAAISFGDPVHYVPWIYLGQAVKNGTSAFQYFRPDLPGGIFQYFSLPDNKDEEETFNNLMTTFTKTMDSAAKLHDFSGYSCIADIGGGYGELLMEIMALNPSVKEGIVLELPEVVDTVPALPSNFQGTLSWVKGDMFKGIPLNADCYVMKSVLHDWTDDRCLTILSNIKAAMPPGATLINFDRLMPDFDQGAPPFHPAKAMDLNMMTLVDGKERTKQQWHDLMAQAGFTIKSITEGGSMAAIVAVPT